MEKIKHPELNDYFVSETGEIYDKDKKKMDIIIFQSIKKCMQYID